MLPERLKKCLAIIRWSPATLAASLQQETSLVEAWLDDSAPIPVKLASWLEALCFTHEAADLMRPSLDANQHKAGRSAGIRQEHVPVYSYNLLRTLERGPVLLKSLFGTDDEGAVFFLVSRGLAERDGANLAITGTGRQVGRLAG